MKHGRLMGDVRVLGEFCIACGVDAWLSDGKQHDKPPDWRLPRGLAGLAGLRADAPSEARGADGERAGRPRGSRRSGRAVGSVDYRNDKFADVGLSVARTASGRAGLAAAGDLAGLREGRRYGGTVGVARDYAG